MIDLSLVHHYKLIYQAAGKHYNMMTFDELKAIPVRDLIDDPGVIFMWATSPKLNEAIDLIRAWDFYYRGIAYIWVKTAKDGHIIKGQGIRPSFVKPTTELVLIGSTEKEGRTLALQTESQGQLIFAPRGRHSEKPAEARNRIEDLFGPIPKLEMFARYKSLGWDVWGLESDGPMEAEYALSTRLRDDLENVKKQKMLEEVLDGLDQD